MQGEVITRTDSVNSIRYCVFHAHTQACSPPPAPPDITEETILSHQLQPQGRTWWVAPTCNHSSSSITMGLFSIKRKKKSSNYHLIRYYHLISKIYEVTCQHVLTNACNSQHMKLWLLILFWKKCKEIGKGHYQRTRGSSSKFFALQNSSTPVKYVVSSQCAVPDGRISRYSLSRLDWICDWSYMWIFQGNFPMAKFLPKEAGVYTLLT